MTNSSIFAKVLSLLLCIMMFAGVFTACFQNTESNPEISTQTSTTPTTGTTTGDRVDNEPTEDPVNPEPVDPNELFSGSTTLSNDALIYGALANDVFIGGEDVAAMIPADVKVEAGASSLSLSIKKVEEETLENTLSNLDVHVSGVAANNTVPMTVKLGAILPIGLANTELKLYHIENDIPVLMTRVSSVTDFAIHNQYVYDAETGNVTIYVASFSVFTAVESNADVWDGESVDYSWYNTTDTAFVLNSAAQFIGFRDIVDGTAENIERDTFEGKTVTLATDIDLASKLFNPIGGGWAYLDGNTFNGTFDGGNYTIYNLYVNGWELDETGDQHSGTSKGAGLFSSLHNATIKNLAVVGADLVVETTSIGIIAGVAQGKCTFENIVVSKATLGNYQMRNGGIVGDIYVIESDNVPEGEYSHVFKNIVVDSSVKLSSMWGDFDTGNGGVVGGKYGTAKVLMQNVIVAAELDVFSDVTAAYQWYAYRRCGMLVGYTGQNSPKQATNAAADFLTCENVSVYYGNWTNYTYYQFANQTDEQDNRLWNSNYPWVRAQESDYNGPFSNVRYGNPIIGGQKINTLELAEANKTGFAAITFNQLYGGGQGVYGTNEHTGVTIDYSLTKTIYIQNNLEWTNLKLYYWFANGDDTWTTLVDPITLTEENGAYKVVLPAYAFGFRITADGENVTRDFYLSEVTEPETYNLNFEHVHYFVSNKCDCGAVKQLLEHEFTLGEDGEAGHKDSSSDQTTYTETNGDYTLSITNGSKFYPASHDEQGNASFKLGTGSAIGKFEFTIPNDVEKVIIYVAGYKNNNATIEVNGVQYEITTLSNNGEYTAITIDTSETKTVSFTTTEKNDKRCMINTITFVTTKVVKVHECDENEEIPAVDPTCTAAGLTAGKACSVCGKVMVAQETVNATGHTEEIIHAVDATCTKNGLTEGTRCSVCETILVEQEAVLSTGHSYDAGTCTICGEAFPTTSGTKTYVFSDYTAGTQYAENEEHILDEYVTMFTTQCHFTSELRIYSSSTNNGYAIIKSINPISVISVNAGNKVDTINIYGSNDGVNWTTEPIATISVTSTSYNDYTAEFEDEYKWLKLDVAGTNQVRLKSMTLTTVPDCAHASTTEKVVDPTCTEAGRTDIVCSNCGKVMSTVAGDPATGHQNTTTTTVDATCTEAGSTTVTCNDCGATVSTETIEALGHTTDNGTCERCEETIGGSTEPTPDPETPVETTVSMDIFANKGSLVDKVITWTSGDVTVSNAQGSSTSSILTTDTNLFRVYANSTFTISAPNISKIVITCTSDSYATACKNTFLNVDDCTATISGSVVTITFKTPVDSVTAKATAQFRLNNIEVTYTTGDNGGSEGGETEECKHSNTKETTTATCETSGVTTVTCNDCGVTVSTTNVEALGHTTDNGTCERCGETIGGSSEPTLIEKTYLYTFTSTQFSANGTKALGGVNWTLAGDGGYWGYDSTKGQQLGSSGSPYKSMTLTSASFSNVSKIVINTSGASSVNATFTVTVNGKQVGSSTKITTTATAYTFTLDEPATGEIVITYTQTSSKALYIKSISVTYAE